MSASCNDCAMAAQPAGNSGNTRARGKRNKSRAPSEDWRTTSSTGAPFVAAPNSSRVRWAFDPRNGAALRAPLELYIPESQWNFNPYTGLVWVPSPHQNTPSPYQYAPLQQLNQNGAQHTSRFYYQQSLPPRTATSSSVPRFSFMSTSSGNFPPPLPQTFEGPRASLQTPHPLSNKSSSTVNAVSSAGRGASQLFSDVQLCGSVVKSALIDTGATLSMIPMRTISSLPNPPTVENFQSIPPSIVGVGGASATVRGYIDAPLVIAGAHIQHPIIVVEELAFPLLIGMDILGPHDAQLGVGASKSFRLDIERCRVCDEERSPATRLRSIPAVAAVSGQVVLQPRAASRVVVHLPPAILGASQPTRNSQLPAPPLPPPVASQPRFDGPPPIRKKPPPQLMDIQIPEPDDISKFLSISGDKSSPSHQLLNQNRRPKRVVNLPARLEDYQLGATYQPTFVVSANLQKIPEDFTIDYTYPNYDGTVSSSTNYVYATSTPTNALTPITTPNSTRAVATRDTLANRAAAPFESAVAPNLVKYSSAPRTKSNLSPRLTSSHVAPTVSSFSIFSSATPSSTAANPFYHRRTPSLLSTSIYEGSQSAVAATAPPQMSDKVNTSLNQRATTRVPRRRPRASPPAEGAASRRRRRHHAHPRRPQGAHASPRPRLSCVPARRQPVCAPRSRGPRRRLPHAPEDQRWRD